MFQRYLETVLPEDAARTRLVRDGMMQETPGRVPLRPAPRAHAIARGDRRRAPAAARPLSPLLCAPRHCAARDRAVRRSSIRSRARVSAGVRPHRVDRGARADRQRAGRARAPPGGAHVPLALPHAPLPAARRVRSLSSRARTSASSRAASTCPGGASLRRARAVRLPPQPGRHLARRQLRAGSLRHARRRS